MEIKITQEHKKSSILFQKTKSEIKNIVGRPPDHAWPEHWVYNKILWNPDSEKFVDLKVDFTIGSSVVDICTGVRIW